MIGMSGHLHDVDITNQAPCTNHCPEKGHGIAVSLELVGGNSNDYFGPIPPNNPPPASLTGATMCRSEGIYGTPWAGTRYRGHLDTMTECGVPGGSGADLPSRGLAGERELPVHRLPVQLRADAPAPQRVPEQQPAAPDGRDGNHDGLVRPDRRRATRAQGRDARPACRWCPRSTRARAPTACTARRTARATPRTRTARATRRRRPRASSRSARPTANGAPANSEGFVKVDALIGQHRHAGRRGRRALPGLDDRRAPQHDGLPGLHGPAAARHDRCA